jgi:hypothetical protein
MGITGGVEDEETRRRIPEQNKDTGQRIEEEEENRQR